jgi:hypothetical protein
MVNMEPEDPREWEVTVNRRKCPVVYYPANYIGCKLLPDSYKCTFEDCPLKTTPTTELCPICNKPLYGTGKTLTSMEDERTVHLACMISEPCDCPHENSGCHYSGYCKHRKDPDKELNGTCLPTCGVKFPGDGKCE